MVLERWRELDPGNGRRSLGRARRVSSRGAERQDVPQWIMHHTLASNHLAIGRAGDDTPLAQLGVSKTAPGVSGEAERRPSRQRLSTRIRAGAAGSPRSSRLICLTRDSTAIRPLASEHWSMPASSAMSQTLVLAFGSFRQSNMAPSSRSACVMIKLLPWSAATSFMICRLLVVVFIFFPGRGSGGLGTFAVRGWWQFGKNGFLAGSPNYLGAESAANEIKQSGNGMDFIPKPKIGMIIRVDGDDGYPACKSRRYFVQHGPELLARPAPWSQKRHQDRLL